MNWEWVRTAGGNQNQKATAIAVDVNNDVIISGTFNSSSISLGSNNLILNNNDSSGFASNYFIAKFSQNGQAVWAKKAVSNVGMSSNKMVTDNIGNIYACGYISNSNSVINTISFDGNSSYTHINGGKSFLIKYSQSGIAQWVMFINNRYWGYDSISALKWDKKSNSLIIGGFCLGDTVNIGGSKITGSGNYMQSSFVAKISVQQGNVIWLKATKSNSYLSKINEIAIDSSGSFYTAASFTGSFLVLPSGDTLFNSGPSTGALFSDGYLAKYDNNGVVQWTKKGICNGNDEFTTVECLNNNHLISGGYNSSPLTISSIALNSNNYLLEFDFSGNLISTQTLGATVKTIRKFNTKNGFFIGGSFTADSIVLGNNIIHKLSNPLLNNNNLFFARCDSFGIYNAAVSAGGISVSQLNASFADDSNKIYICGAFNQSSINFGSNIYNANGVSDLFFAKLNAGFLYPVPYKFNLGGSVFAGLLPVDFAVVYLYDSNQNIVASCNIDTSSMGFYQFYQKPMGNYKVSAELLTNSVYFFQNYISSFYPDKINFNDASVIWLNTNRWGRDIFLQKQSDITEKDIDFGKVKVYPNPAKTSLNLSFVNRIDSQVKIEVISTNSQQLIALSKFISNNDESVSIDISSLEAGFYILILSNKTGNLMRFKFIKTE